MRRDPYGHRWSLIERVQAKQSAAFHRSIREGAAEPRWPAGEPAPIFDADERREKEKGA